jgi:hypothetical protein
MPPATKKPEPVNLGQVLQAGSALGFVSRDAGPARRKTGPKRTEPQDKITIAGPKRIIDRLKAYCDREGGLTYHAAIDALLDAVEK